MHNEKIVFRTDKKEKKTESKISTHKLVLPCFGM